MENPIQGFHTREWKEDRNGCKGIRHEMLQIILNSKEKLLGLSEQKIMHILGNPDRNDLYTRHQKFYIYYTDRSPECANPGDNPDLLIIRFNATGYSNEIFAQKGFSTQ
jgi:hypothetical protein